LIVQNDIKKEEPCVIGLNIAEISFLRNQQGEISLTGRYQSQGLIRIIISGIPCVSARKAQLSPLF
jgi:hypothetical protein